MLKKIQSKKRTALLALVCFLAGVAIKPTFLLLWHIALSPIMHDAIEKGDALQVKNLLRGGANPNQHGMGGLLGGTPLDFAFGKSDFEMVKLLLDEGANVNEKDAGYTPLMKAPTPKIAKLLLDRGANPLIRSKEGYTAWQLAKYDGADDVAKVIMEYENRSKNSFSP